MWCSDGYEGGSISFVNWQPALHVSADPSLFGEDERGPDDDLRMQFDGISRFDADEKRAIRSLREGMISKHAARRRPSVNGCATNGERK
jgi:hypothetical protein